jgi:peptide/nickel transport system substrate-binding protein
MTAERDLSRRAVLKMGVGVISLGLLNACAPQAPAASQTQAPAATTAPATMAPAASAPTAAPAAAPTQVAAAKPAPAAQAAPTTKPGLQLGAQLIGKLEGPTVITDAAQFPKTFKEAPALAELVKAGKLPPVAQRVSQDPLVLKPLNEIGKYGGTWRRGFTGPADGWNGIRCAGHDTLLFWNFDRTEVVPNIAKSWDMSPDGKTLVVQLRRGMKWSDGEPFTADDMMFWWNDIAQNKELVPSLLPNLFINGKPISIEKVDETTIRFGFPDPYFYFTSLIAGNKPPGAGPAEMRQDGLGVCGYLPAHYLKQFLPKYAGQDTVDQAARAAGFDNWVSMMKAKADWCLNPDIPVITAWKTVQPINTPLWSLERNPYSIWVDTDGNQLPYIDKVQLTLGENLEIINFRAIAGEFDYQERHMDIGKLPVLLENRQKGGYNIHLDTADFGCDLSLAPILDYQADPEIGDLLHNTDFRRALSLGIDRDQLNETFWLGTGQPGSAAPPDENVYAPGPEYRKLWSTHDPAQANGLLDKIGLTKRDAAGMRLRPSGGSLAIEVTTYGGQFIQATQICEMIGQQWKAIGITIRVNEIERGLGEKRMLNGDVQIFAWPPDDSGEILQSGQVLPIAKVPFNRLGQTYGLWFQSNGKEGQEPPPKLKQALDMYRQAFGVPDDERIRLGKEIWKIVIDEVWHIGTVGVSPASVGVRVVNTKLGNIPARQYNTINVRTPGTSRPEQFYFKT